MCTTTFLALKKRPSAFPNIAQNYHKSGVNRPGSVRGLNGLIMDYSRCYLTCTKLSLEVNKCVSEVYGAKPLDSLPNNEIKVVNLFL